MLRKVEALLNDSPYFPYHLENKVNITTCLSHLIIFLAAYTLLLVHLSWSFSRSLFYGFNNHHDLLKHPLSVMWMGVLPFFLWIAEIFLFCASFLMVQLIISSWVQVLYFNQFICSHSLYILLFLVVDSSTDYSHQCLDLEWLLLEWFLICFFLVCLIPLTKENFLLFWSGYMFTSLYVILLKYTSPSYMERK